MDKLQCGVCGSPGLVHFEGESFDIEHRGYSERVAGLSGLRCAKCGEVFFDAQSAQRYAAVSDSLVLQAREDEGELLRRARRSLNLTQTEAALLAGGGPNAFSRYETGKTRPVAAVVNLFRLLEAHPELLRELPRLPGKGAVRMRKEVASGRRSRTAARTPGKSAPRRRHALTAP